MTARPLPTLGDLEQYVLFALLALGDGAYGAAVQREIEARTGRRVTAGAVYTVLDRLARRGLVASWIGDPTPERGGRRKRHYRLEPAGARALRRAHERRLSMARGLLDELHTLAEGKGAGT